jgi:hypothetical protein
MIERQEMIRSIIREHPEIDDDDLHKMLSLYAVGTFNMVQSDRWKSLCAKYA